MGGILGGGGPSIQAPEPAPAPAPLPPPPERTDAQVQDLADTQRRRYYRNQGGRAMDFLSGGNGVTDPGTHAVRYLGGSSAV